MCIPLCVLGRVIVWDIHPSSPAYGTTLMMAPGTSNHLSVTALSWGPEPTPQRLFVACGDGRVSELDVASGERRRSALAPQSVLCLQVRGSLVLAAGVTGFLKVHLSLSLSLSPHLSLSLHLSGGQR